MYAINTIGASPPTEPLTLVKASRQASSDAKLRTAPAANRTVMVSAEDSLARSKADKRAASASASSLRLARASSSSSKTQVYLSLDIPLRVIDAAVAGVRTAQGALAKEPGVERATVNLMTERGTVLFDARVLTPERIAELASAIAAC